MRFPAPTLAACLGLAIFACPPPAASQDDRDFIFTDAEGHLVLRFAGTGASGLSARQIEDVANVELSIMVHERLRADAAFEAEPVDTGWADPMEARIAEHMSTTAPEFSPLDVECRSASCRVVLEHAGGWSVAEHRWLAGIAQRAVEAFIAADPHSFEPVFMIVARYQEPAQPYISLILPRAAAAGRE
jgi:hypothetical protein